MPRFRHHLGDARVRHPTPLRLRSPFVGRDYGGSAGWRGPGWQRIRKGVLARDKGRSTISGMSEGEDGVQLTVDHIQPVRWADPSYMNNPINLRVTDGRHNPYADVAASARFRRNRRGRR